jgi:predicted DNA-binding transcriptional regulator YafY
MQILRRHRGSVAGNTLARETKVSLRTVRRDIATIQAMGADIEAEAGVGYMLRPGFLLPPISLKEDEIIALVAGIKWISNNTDDDLALSAQNALAKIISVLPSEIRHLTENNTLYIGTQNSGDAAVSLKDVRHALKNQLKMQVAYEDGNGSVTERVIWPVMLGFVENRRFIAGWCELRAGFRLFRTDRIRAVTFLSERYPGDRKALVRKWRREEDNRK